MLLMSPKLLPSPWHIQRKALLGLVHIGRATTDGFRMNPQQIP
jgi:hypothetical protein